MPQFNTGSADWDQGLGQLSNMLFPDVSKIAQAGYYGAMTRNQQIEADRKQQSIDAIRSIPGAIASIGNAQTPFQTLSQAGPPKQLSAMLPVLGQGTGQGAAQGLAEAISNGIQPGGLGAGTAPPMSSPAPGAGAPAAPTNSGSSGGTLPTDSMSAAMHPASVMLPGGGGVIYAAPAASDGSPAKAFDLTPLMSLFAQAGPEVDQAKIQAAIGALISKGELSGVISKPLADQIQLRFNPSEIGANMRQQMVTGEQRYEFGQGLVPVLDTTTNAITQVPREVLAQDNGQRYRAVDPQIMNQNTVTGEQRYEFGQALIPVWDNQTNTATKITREVLNQDNRQRYRPISDATADLYNAPPPALTPELQSQNDQLDDRVLQRFNPTTANKTDVNVPVVLEDPASSFRTLTDEIQRNNQKYRYNREGAATEAYQQLQREGRIVTPDRATNPIGRNLSGYLTGQAGANPDVVKVPVKNKDGQQVLVDRLRLRVLPPRAPGAAPAPLPGGPGAGILAPQPGSTMPPQSAASVSAPQGPQAGPVPPTPLRPQAPGTWRPGDPGSGWNPPRLANPPPPAPIPPPSVPPGGGMMRPSDIAKARGQAAPRGVPVTGAGGPQGATSSVAAPGAQNGGAVEGDVRINPQGVLAIIRNGQLVPMTPQQIQQYQAAQQQRAQGQ